MCFFDAAKIGERMSGMCLLRSQLTARAQGNRNRCQGFTDGELTNQISSCCCVFTTLIQSGASSKKYVSRAGRVDSREVQVCDRPAFATRTDFFVGAAANLTNTSV